MQGRVYVFILKVDSPTPYYKVISSFWKYHMFGHIVFYHYLANAGMKYSQTQTLFLSEASSARGNNKDES